MEEHGNPDGANSGDSNLLSTSAVGDGGASWRVPRPDGSLKWGKQNELSNLQKFTNDGSFLREFKSKQSDDSCTEASKSSNMYIKPALSANQLAAKVMQLRMNGKHEEAEELLKEADEYEGKSKAGIITTASSYMVHDIRTQEKKKEEDADMHLAQSILQNKQYKEDDEYEYEYDEGPTRKKRVKSEDAHKSCFQKCILTQQERCSFCFENPKMPRHLVISIANFTYLMLPPWQPVVQGHCCILPMQHELATRGVDENVWDEMRNFKKCVVMMFAKKGKDVVFLETVMQLAKQSRHCLVECIPLPPHLAKQASLFFKKAIDEAEEEWSQHNSKKLIDTSEKGLRHSIPEDFPYFHVEFGVKKGFVHVIDDESQFKSSFGINVIRGILNLPPALDHRRKHDVFSDAQKQAVVKFSRDWEPFDWTKQLD